MLTCKHFRSQIKSCVVEGREATGPGVGSSWTQLRREMGAEVEIHCDQLSPTGNSFLSVREEQRQKKDPIGWNIKFHSITSRTNRRWTDEWIDGWVDSSSIVCLSGFSNDRREQR